ncbi:hypothetical protein RGQ15_04025 [Paracoccus sp. MBLB3053]|uniref:DUF2282 domain-containing protein n=1 Tax=Paracoccus aurantius TaxID=3073814 RepID=A0ABU2HNY1_9RHOB|nr:hypothetical protein [Paracoccus sp. MBLB3053]MDS9466750.1 hypothetical protein [Paracoccus sp. MBLB3053]
MTLTIARAAILAAIVAYPACADTGQTSANIMAMGAEILNKAMTQGGYTNVKDNYWWNAVERDCLYVPASNDRAMAVMVVKPTICSLAARGKTGPGAGCPIGTHEAEFDLYPDCGRIMAGR